MSYTDIIIAVHGIGAQSRNATVRSVATRLADSPTLYGSGQPGFAPQPLGYFHTDMHQAVKVSPLDNLPNLSGSLKETGFAEVFWADIPQKVVQEKRTLEEIKAWARTVVARARFLFGKAQEETKAREKRAEAARAAGQTPPEVAPLIQPDFSLAAEVLEEVVDTVYVLENLAWITEKAGLMKFDLREVLEEYLGDVQIVTEFTLFRRDIIGRFHRALEQIHKDHPGARLHIVAHSEGTVIAFLGLLHAMSNRRYVPAGFSEEVASAGSASGTAASCRYVPPGSAAGAAAAGSAEGKARGLEEAVTQPWLQHVHGFMTIGSPIDKHLLLWDRLWQDIDLSKSAAVLRKCQIRWRNYYDFGDPIGFKLETARRWLDGKGDKVFEFCGCPDCGHDIGFARYLLPGKAHNDYWEDPVVFEHFIRSAMTRKSGSCPPRPASRPLVKVISPSLPYVLSAVLLLIGTYILYKAVTEFINPDIEPLQRYVQFMIEGDPPEVDEGSRFRLLFNSACLAGLVAGLTIAARLPLLALGMWLRASLAFLAGCLCYLGIDGLAREQIGVVFQKGIGPGWETPGVLLTGLLVVLVGLSTTKRPKRRGLAGATERGERWFAKGARPLIFCGAVAIVLIVGLQMWDSHSKRRAPRKESPAAVGKTAAMTPEARARKVELRKLSKLMLVPRPVWPVLLAGAGFLYLWWLATLIFDLAFVWNRYVRGGAALQRLRMWSELGGEGAAEKAGDGQRPPTTRHAGGEEKCRNTCGDATGEATAAAGDSPI